MKNSSKSSTNNKKQQKQQDKQHLTFGRSKAARVCFSHINGNPEKLRPRGVGPRRVVVPANFVSIGCQKMLLTFWKVKHCKGGRRGCFDGRRPKKQQQAASHNKNTNNKKSSNKQQNQEQNSTNNNPETVRAKRCGSRRWGSSRGVSVVFEALKCAGSPKAGVPKGAAANDGVPKGGAQNGGEPKISSFFQSPATIFILSFTLGNAGTLESWCLEFLGWLSCEAPAAPKPPGHTTARQHKRAHFGQGHL